MNGLTIWAKTYGGIGIDHGKSVIKNSDGGYIIAGYTNSFDSIATNAYLIKTDSSGFVLWSKTYGINNGSSAASIAQTSDSGFIIAGATYSSVNLVDIYLIKTDINGNSGCYETNQLTIGNTVALNVNSLTTSVSSSGVQINPSTITTVVIETTSTLCSTVGIEDPLNFSQILAYPNPSSGEFNFSGLGKSDKIEIFNINGQLIYQAVSNNNIENVNISRKSKGLYFYRITNEITIIQQGKIIIQ